MKKIGLVVNPFAGMGGTAGVKGTDGEEALQISIKTGAVPMAHKRTVRALRKLLPIKDKIEIVTCSDEMGENEIRELGFKGKIILNVRDKITDSIDVFHAAKKIFAQTIDLLIFTGGDGTANDILRAVGDKIPIIAIPAGVKMRSPVYAIDPECAGELAFKYLTGEILNLNRIEVFNVDEEDYRNDKLTEKLQGYLLSPYDENYLQGKKIYSSLKDKKVQDEIALYIVNNMLPNVFYLIGPGTTTKAVMDILNLPNTLFGVDIIYNKQIVRNNVSEHEILSIIGAKDAKLIISIIGGQGYLFGRGNQQISYKIINKLTKENIIIISCPDKIKQLNRKPICVDTNDEYTDNMLKGYARIVTGYEDEIMYPVR